MLRQIYSGICYHKCQYEIHEMQRRSFRKKRQSQKECKCRNGMPWWETVGGMHVISGNLMQLYGWKMLFKIQHRPWLIPCLLYNDGYQPWCQLWEQHESCHSIPVKKQTCHCSIRHPITNKGNISKEHIRNWRIKRNDPEMKICFFIANNQNYQRQDKHKVRNIKCTVFLHMQLIKLKYTPNP